MKTNKLVVTLNKEMQIGFERGLNQVYANSNLVNEFIVKPSFELAPKQTLMAAFKNAESNATLTIKPSLLAEREVTAASYEQQAVDNDVAQMQQPTSTGYEYYTILPKEIMTAPGKWYFSLQVCQVPDNTNISAEELAKQMPIKTSDIAYFTVYSSLAGTGPDGSPATDLDIVALYNQAIATKKEAEKLVETAGEYAPYVDTANGNWYQYNNEKQEFVNTGVHAQGPVGPMPDLSDYSTKQYVDDAIAAAVTTALNTPV